MSIADSRRSTIVRPRVHVPLSSTRTGSCWVRTKDGARTAATAPASPIVAVSDFVRAVPDQIARWAPRPWLALGTDGFGRSDDRAALRRFFETDTGHVVVAVLSKLADAGEIEPKVVQSAIERFGIDVERTAPWVD